MDRTPDFDEYLKKRSAPPTKKQVTLESVDGFLKEALRINSHIVQLHQHLRSIRRAYLARAQPRRGHGTSTDGSPTILSDREREDVDRNAKEMLGDLNYSIEGLDGAEKLRYGNETKIIQKKYGTALGVLGSWASGGVASGKTPEHLEAEGRAQEVKTHREGVLWYLRQQLQLCSQTQKDMMEQRLLREVELNRNLGSQGPNMADFAAFKPTKKTMSDLNGSGSDNAYQDPGFSQGLSAEQVQMFEEGNQDMMNHFESMNKSVQTAQQSLAEVSELQTKLIDNLVTQNDQIEFLVADSQNTADNVSGGNVQLKKATERPSAARWTFYAASGLSLTLVIWDLIF